jgi:hypothetical protein
MPDVTTETIVARRPETLSAPVDDELVMLDTRTSTYFGLDRIGNRIWELIEEPKLVGDICAVLQREFDVSEARCLEDVAAFVEQLERADLIELR